MVGGPRVAKVIEEIRKLAQAPRPTALLLIGETGVGKEIAARVLFEAIAVRLLRSLAEEKNAAALPVVLGPRFIAVNCAALPEALSASELFGVGADVGTGVAARRGPLLEAGEGVVLLDEIESMRTSDQASLLRVLDPPHRVTPVGTTTAVPVNAMVVACTNVEPTRLVAENRLRSDLFARLRVHTLEIPPVRDRREDIPALLAYLAGGEVRIDPSALTALLLHDHPLNVRGLLAVVERARRRHQLAGETGPSVDTGPICILREDLDAELIAIADDLFREPADHSDEMTVFEFHAERPDPLLEHVFQQAAEILSSYQLTTSNDGLRITHRLREARFDDLWETARRERTAAKAHPKRRSRGGIRRSVARAHRRSGTCARSAPRRAASDTGCGRASVCDTVAKEGGADVSQGIARAEEQATTRRQTARIRSDPVFGGVTGHELIGHGQPDRQARALMSSRESNVYATAAGNRITGVGAVLGQACQRGNHTCPVSGTTHPPQCRQTSIPFAGISPLPFHPSALKRIS